MEIKLRARLSAYSKVDSFSTTDSILPNTSFPGAQGSLLGVGSDGKYKLFPTISEQQVDELFEGQEIPTIVQKSEIDTLFEEQEQNSVVDKEDIDTLFEKSDDDSITRVSYAEIDSLFS
jgi:hypothetical protein